MIAVIRHCEQSEATHNGVRDVDCRATLAMTNVGSL